VLRALLGLLRPTAGDRLGYVETLYRHDFTADPSEAAALFGIGLDDLVGWVRRAGEPPAAPPDLSQERPPARSVEPEPTAVLEESEPDYPARAPEPAPDESVGEPELDDAPPVRETFPHLVVDPVAAEPEAIASDLEPAPVTEPVPESEPEPVTPVWTAPEPVGASADQGEAEPALDLDLVVTAPADEPEALERVQPEPAAEPLPSAVAEPVLHEPEPVADSAEPAPPAAADEDETVLGHHAAFELQPPVAPEPERRPPVHRPTAVEGPVVDADPE